MLNGLMFNVTTNKYARKVGAYRIAHFLRQHNWDVEVIDFALNWTLEELKELAKSRLNANSKFIGFSHMFSVWSETLESFTQWLKEKYPHILLISGSGVNPKFDAHYIDIYVKGFGEHAVLKLLEWHTSNGLMPSFNIIDGNRKMIDANAFYPSFPMRDLNVIYEGRDFIEPSEWLTIEFARGCKFKCDFCNFPVLGVKGDYSRDTDNLKHQLIDAYNRFGITNYVVSDETFNDRTEKITKFADAVETLPFEPWFSGFIRADLLISRPRDKEELLRMNFLGQYYGIESFKPKSVKIVGKGMHPDRIKSGLIDLKKYFSENSGNRYRGTLSFIIGLPHETKNSLEMTRRWLVNNWQGQSFIFFSMEIPKGNHDAHSLISKNPKKYGYREMTEIANINLNEIKQNQINVSRDIFLWENENMNIIDSAHIYDRFSATRYNPRNDFRLDNWSIGHPGLSTNIDDRLNVKDCKEHSSQELTEEQIKMVEIYKQKKLSL